MAPLRTALATLLLAAAAESLTKTVTITCPEGYSLLNTSCYMLSHVAVEGKNADSFCRSTNGEAAVIETEEEMDLLKNNLLNTTVYLGINIRRYRENLFEFLLKMSGHNGYTNFHAGEPDNFGAEDCVVADAISGFEWKDVHCTESYKVLCKAPAGMRPAVPACPDGTVMFQDRSCFLSDNTTARNWTEANAWCGSHGMTLPSVHSREEGEFIIGLPLGNTYTNFGLTDGTVDGVFLWSDGTLLDYENWAESQPDGGDNSRCGHLDVHSGLWWDGYCSLLYYGTICKRPVFYV